MNKLLIFTAPSGAGKTTIVKYLLAKFPNLAFSVSATNRSRREHEIDGKDYYFLSTDEFLRRHQAGEFLEFEEVYEQQYYGTLYRELERLWALGKVVVFDVDVKGATNIKKAYPNQSLAVFVKPPSKETLLERLQLRRTETPESLHKRIARATEELAYETTFDTVVVNDVLENALQDAERQVAQFLTKN